MSFGNSFLCVNVNSKLLPSNTFIFKKCGNTLNSETTMNLEGGEKES